VHQPNAIILAFSKLLLDVIVVSVLDFDLSAIQQMSFSFDHERSRCRKRIVHVFNARPGHAFLIDDDYSLRGNDEQISSAFESSLD
jgi:hypothetical protein